MLPLTGFRTQVLSSLFFTAFLTACAATPAPLQQNLKAETDDLAMTVDWALTLLEQQGRENVLVVFDIDNTLLAMEQGLGSDQWYYWQKDLGMEDPCSPMLVADRFAVQGAIFHASAMRPTQADAAEQVARVQRAGVRTIALTSRGSDYQLQTFRELRRAGISFWETALEPARGWPDSFVPEGGSRPALYQDGVFLTAGQHKGVMLQALLDKTGTPTPAVIVMVDDKQENLDAVLEGFADSPAVVHAWRYTREDGEVETFDAEEADRRWQQVYPALKQVQGVFGADNFDLPDSYSPECAE